MGRVAQAARSVVECEADWQSFLRAFGSAYNALDAQLEGLAAAERSLFEGSS